jgi:PAS domain S-box-containing protein
VAPDSGNGPPDARTLNRADSDLFVEALLKHSFDAISFSDRRSRRLVEVSDSFCGLTGYARPELIGRTSFELGLIDDNAAHANVVDLTDQHLGGLYEGRLRRRDGALRRVEFSVAPVAEGELVLTIVRDVTERRDAETQLRASEQRFRTAVESMLDSFAIVSPIRDDGGEIVGFRYEYANDAHCLLVGLGSDQLLGRQLGELFDGFRDSERFAVYRQVALTGEPVTTDEVTSHEVWRGWAPDGRVISTTIATMGENLVVSGRDVTERRDAEKEFELRAQLLDLAHDAVIVRDPVESRVTFWNREAESVYGYSHTDAFGQITHDLLVTVFPESREAVDDALAREGQWEGDVRHTRKDGTEIVVASRQALQRDAAGRPAAIIELNSDVTERRRAERRIGELNRNLDRRAGELDAANQELESFAYSVAHDLRGPLRAIAGFTDLLGRGDHIGQDDELGHALIKRTTTAARTMGELIDALLELAQLSRRALRIGRVDLSAVAREIADELRSGGADREVEFVIEGGLEAEADPRLARILLRSLLENAWKYSGSRPRARIEVTRGGSSAFVVRDNGAGFDMAYSDQLFRPFGRLHRQDEFPGTGVGLATAERIIRRHGGTLTAEGHVGEGAAFSFSFKHEKEIRQ